MGVSIQGGSTLSLANKLEDQNRKLFEELDKKLQDASLGFNSVLLDNDSQFSTDHIFRGKLQEEFKELGDNDSLNGSLFNGNDIDFGDDISLDESLEQNLRPQLGDELENFRKELQEKAKFLSFENDQSSLTEKAIIPPVDQEISFLDSNVRQVNTSSALFDGEVSLSINPIPNPTVTKSSDKSNSKEKEAFDSSHDEANLNAINERFNRLVAEELNRTNSILNDSSKNDDFGMVFDPAPSSPRYSANSKHTSEKIPSVGIKTPRATSVVANDKSNTTTSNKDTSYDFSTTFPSASFPTDRLDSFLNSSSEHNQLPLSNASPIPLQSRPSDFDMKFFNTSDEKRLSQNTFDIENLDLSRFSKFEPPQMSDPRFFDFGNQPIKDENRDGKIGDTPVSISEVDYLKQPPNASFDMNPNSAVLIQEEAMKVGGGSKLVNGEYQLPKFSDSDFPKENENEAVIGVLRNLQERITQLESERNAAKSHISYLETELARVRQMEFRKSVLDEKETIGRAETTKNTKSQISDESSKSSALKRSNDGVKNKSSSAGSGNKSARSFDKFDRKRLEVQEHSLEAKELDSELLRKRAELDLRRQEIRHETERLRRNFSSESKDDVDVESRRDNDAVDEFAGASIVRQREQEFREEIQRQIERDRLDDYKYDDLKLGSNDFSTAAVMADQDELKLGNALDYQEDNLENAKRGRKFETFRNTNDSSEFGMFYILATKNDGLNSMIIIQDFENELDGLSSDIAFLSKRVNSAAPINRIPDVPRTKNPTNDIKVDNTKVAADLRKTRDELQQLRERLKQKQTKSEYQDYSVPVHKVDSQNHAKTQTKPVSSQKPNKPKKFASANSTPANKKVNQKPGPYAIQTLNPTWKKVEPVRGRKPVRLPQNSTVKRSHSAGSTIRTKSSKKSSNVESRKITPPSNSGTTISEEDWSIEGMGDLQSVGEIDEELERKLQDAKFRAEVRQGLENVFEGMGDSEEFRKGLPFMVGKSHPKFAFAERVDPNTHTKKSVESVNEVPQESYRDSAFGSQTIDQLIVALRVLEEELSTMKKEYDSLIDNYLPQNGIETDEVSRKDVRERLREVIKSMDVKADQISILRDIIHSSVSRIKMSEMDRNKQQSNVENWTSQIVSEQQQRKRKESSKSTNYKTSSAPTSTQPSPTRSFPHNSGYNNKDFGSLMNRTYSAPKQEEEFERSRYPRRSSSAKSRATSRGSSRSKSPGRAKEMLILLRNSLKVKEALIEAMG
ncbi:hypothetical protein HK098_004703 [Nowakowskiella sp. JEL0407]|nr:hypothetical protein HK098_004703 [Nowakowskiella sp. JEL0407]